MPDTESKISTKEISFPKGGGAIQGIGDTFKTNLFSGAGSYSIPVPTTPARGFEPQLSVNYSSAAGNGIFGLGFSLSLSKVSVSIAKGIPRYDGTDRYELDGSILVMQESTAAIPNPRIDHYEKVACNVTLYIPNVQNGFSQIEHWQDQDNDLSFWKVITADNTTSYYGIITQIKNPQNNKEVFEWLIDSSADNKGNQIIYNYVAENAVNVGATIDNVNRSFIANRYIDTIQYGNYTDADGNIQFAFQIAFDYNEWACRPDVFSSYHSGFEIRTCRLCHRIQLIHIFPAELGAPVVVKELAFTYENIQRYTPVVFEGMSMLTKATLSGFRKELDEPQELPSLEFGYTSFQPPSTPLFNMLNMGEGTIPGYLRATQFLPVDLNGEGIPGFLISNGTTNFYLEPLGDGKYGLPATNASFPSDKNIQRGDATITDIDGDGQLELLVNRPGINGFYGRTANGGWNNFIPFEKYPTVSANPKMEFADLSANGKSDLLLADIDNIQYYPSEGKQGYSNTHTIPEEEDFPLVKEQYQQELVTFANMFGDGLAHRVRVCNGLVECWPCLGYGKFGKKVTFDNAPVFGEQFNTAQLFLTDIDGSGTTDLVYVYTDRVELFLNQSGNSFSDAIVVYLPEFYDTIDQISFIDILGNGTNCLVFTKIATIPRHYYYNFSGEFQLPDGSIKQSLKPYLLNKVDNNMGSVIYINYCSSTKFILEDKLTGNPWVTKLPFPVQVVEELTRYELLTGSCYVTKYKYHDGYYDPELSRFLGFGFIESWDSESYEAFENSYSNPDYPVSELNRELFVTPVYTRTWYLNGAPMQQYEQLLTKYKKDYFNKDKAAYNFPESLFSPDIAESNITTFTEAYKALSSNVLRTEIYAVDAAVPYIVTESNYSVTLVQQATTYDYAAFVVTPRESITYHYERNADDPNVEQQFVLKTDPLCGQTVQSCTLHLPRRGAINKDYAEQYILKGIINTDKYFNSDPSDYSMRLRGVKYETSNYNLLGLPDPSSGYFSFDNISAAVQEALQDIIPYMALPSSAIQAQDISRIKYIFLDPDKGVLPSGQVSPQILLHHVAHAEFNNDNIAVMFGQQLTDEVIRELGGYVYDQESGYWENHGLTQLYNNAEGFYTPSGTKSDLGTLNTVEYDNYYLAIIKTSSYVSITPAVTNVVTLTMDYQAMAARKMVDVNGNITEVLFDALGQVVVTSLYGKENGIAVGSMSLSQYVRRIVAPDGKPITFTSVIENKEYYLQGASGYFYYDVNAFEKRKEPASAIYLQRTDYYSAKTDFSCQTTVSYSDGFTRSLAVKTATEGGQWLVSGRNVYNNKGKVCESYLSYFSDTPFYETQDEIISRYKVPPPTITHYDPLSRVVRIDTPKGFFSKVDFTPWEQVHWDEDDTVKDAIYYQQFMANYPADPTQEQADEKKALDMAAGFYATPETDVLDNTGDVIRKIQLLGARSLTTHFKVDILGRVLAEADPRLYASNGYNFRYQYSMSGKAPMVTDSADAGVIKHFSSVFDKQVWSLSPRNYCQVIYYDGLQRQLQLLVKPISGTGPITGFDTFNLVEVFTYGEDAALPAGYNLRGQIYMLKDLSGILTNSSYSMQADLLQTTRQMTSVYKSAVNWRETVPLENDSCTKVYGYNALKLLLSETIANDTIERTYNIEGLLCSISLNTEGVKQNIIRNISYDANRQRTLVAYGNNITTTYSYEASTLRLTRLLSKNGKTIQDITYTYDPVGNITCTRDASIDIVFSNNQKVDPVAASQYDSLYRLISSSGRQHPGITDSTYKNNTKDGSFMQSKFSQTPVADGQSLENYIENYSYDDGGNLVKKLHTAASSTWSVETPVLDNCNRLKDLNYDASGNQRQLAINNVVSLAYNCCENLVSATVIERPDEASDSDYYVYDNTEHRTRKVGELYINATSVNYNDTVYYGNYEILRKGVQTSDGKRTITTDRHTFRIMDGEVCVAIIYRWINDDKKPDQLRFQLNNYLGSVSVELDEKGGLISYEEYFPFGGTSFIAGPSQVDVSLKRYRYSGKECDDSTGLYYYGMRYYVPWLGRWLKPDPAGTVDGLNLFAFVAGNPVTNRDEDGLMYVRAGAYGNRMYQRGSRNVREMRNVKFQQKRFYSEVKSNKNQSFFSWVKSLMPGDLSNTTHSVGAAEAVHIRKDEKAIVKAPNLVYCRTVALEVRNKNKDVVGITVLHYEGRNDVLLKKMIDELHSPHGEVKLEVVRWYSGFDSVTPSVHEFPGRSMDKLTMDFLERFPDLVNDLKKVRSVSDSETNAFIKKYDQRYSLNRLFSFFNIMPIYHAFFKITGSEISSANISGEQKKRIEKKHLSENRS